MRLHPKRGDEHGDDACAHVAALGLVRIEATAAPALFLVARHPPNVRRAPGPARCVPLLEPFDDVGMFLSGGVAEGILARSIQGMRVGAIIDECHDGVKLSQARRPAERLGAAPERILRVGTAGTAGDPASGATRDGAHGGVAAPRRETVDGTDRKGRDA